MTMSGRRQNEMLTDGGVAAITHQAQWTTASGAAMPLKNVAGRKADLGSTSPVFRPV